MGHEPELYNGNEERDGHRSQSQPGEASKTSRKSLQTGHGSRSVDGDGAAVNSSHELLPENEQRLHSQAEIIQALHTRYEGPLPTPELLAGYGEVDVSFPERIVAMAEKNMVSQHKVMEMSARAESRGVLAVTYSFALLPFGALGVAIGGLVVGNDVVSIVSLCATALTSAPSIVRELRKRRGD
ncbi:hypothetical protein R6G85_02595 [Actinotignum urinale]|uniref:hypothetical protein n=1 Tax=Actinotignum urinale TaxID=190146 RepID=UPI002A809815|nr:hypothetical protein [Actinotignum urinale]MDY5151377.1 hypothetical protein [Actinotignum urinale]